MWNTLKRLVKEEEGQGMTEYALILAAIAIVVVVAYKTLGTAISEKVGEISGSEHLELTGEGGE
jgi:pilus assembly protein Flp/PilA